MTAGHFRDIGVDAVAAVAATLGVVLFLYWLISALSGRRHAVHHIHRLAHEIVAVVQTVEQDLAHAPAAPRAGTFRSACQQHRRRADHALNGTQDLARLSLQELQGWLERLHEDHMRIVDVRSALDAEIAVLVRGARLRGAPAREQSSGSHA